MSILAAALNKLGTLGEPSDIEKAAFLERLRAQQEAAQRDRSAQIGIMSAANAAPADISNWIGESATPQGRERMAQVATMPKEYLAPKGVPISAQQAQDIKPGAAGPVLPFLNEATLGANRASEAGRVEKKPFGSGKPASLVAWEQSMDSVDKILNNQMIALLSPAMYNEAVLRKAELESYADEMMKLPRGGVVQPGAGAAMTPEQERAAYKASKAKKK